MTTDTGWGIKTEFVTETPLEHGNWLSIEFETEDEAMTWWNAADVRATYTKLLTLTSPDGKVMSQRVVK